MKLFFLFTFLVLVSCKPETPTEHRYYLARDSWKNIQSVLHFEIKDSLVKGYELNFDDDKNDTLSGVLKNDSLRMYYLTGSRKYQKGDNNYIGKGKLMPLCSLQFKKEYKDSKHNYYEYWYHLEEISQKAYDSLMLRHYYPYPLDNIYKDTLVGDYRFEIMAQGRSLKIKNIWDNLYSTTVCIYDAKTNELLQSFVSDSLAMEHKFYFSYEDYNFDGKKDLFFPSLNRGAYGTEKWEYYRFNSENQRFEYDTLFNEIVSGSVAIEFDFKRKRFLSFTKSGCCWHKDYQYKCVNGKFIETKSFEIDSRVGRKFIIKYVQKNGKIKTIQKSYTDDDISNFLYNKYDKIYQNIVGY